MQRKRRAEMRPTRYKPDHNDHREDKVIDKAAWLPKPDGVSQEPAKRARWGFAKALRFSWKCGLHRRSLPAPRRGGRTRIHGYFLLSSTLQYEVDSPCDYGVTTRRAQACTGSRPGRDRRRLCHWLAGGGGGHFGFSVFRFGGLGPSAEIEGNGHAGVTKFIGESAVDQGAGDDHASDAQGGDALCGGAARAAIVEQAAFQDAHHGLEHRLESAPGSFATARDVSRQCNHGTGILDVFKMLAGGEGAGELRADVAGREIHLHAFPTTFPFRVGEKAI